MTDLIGHATGHACLTGLLDPQRRKVPCDRGCLRQQRRDVVGRVIGVRRHLDRHQHRGPVPRPYRCRADATCGNARILEVISATAAVDPLSDPDRAVISTFSTGRVSNPAWCSMAAAWAFSPTYVSRVVAVRLPASWPASTQTATTASHIPMGRQGCVALHLATRTVAELLLIFRRPLTSVATSAHSLSRSYR